MAGVDRPGERVDRPRHLRPDRLTVARSSSSAVPTVVTVLRRRPSPGAWMVTRSPARAVKAAGGTMLVPVRSTTPAGKRWAANSQASRSRGSRCMSVRSTWSAYTVPCRPSRCPTGYAGFPRPAPSPARDRADRATAFVHFGLRQVERVLALDRPGRHVVAQQVRPGATLTVRQARRVPCTFCVSGHCHSATAIRGHGIPVQQRRVSPFDVTACQAT